MTSKGLEEAKRGLTIIVLLKQVPDIEKVRFDYVEGRLDRSSAEGVINPFDLNALEAAVQLREKIGGKVMVLSMGPPQAVESLRDAIARGADDAILLSDPAFAGADTLATSYTLASAIRKMGHFDLILCGEKTVDGDTAQVGPEVSEFLGIPCVAFVHEIIDADVERVVVCSRLGKNDYKIEIRLPGLLTVTKDVNNPRMPTLKDKLRSRKAEVSIWGAEDLVGFADERLFGTSGSPTRVMNVYAPSTEGRRCIMLEGTPEEKAGKIASILRDLRIVR
ncbi:MAG: electron transfer flavoprotein subunit beta/FixA family protein [Nitrososphaerota archaeon]|nr:electron transfer flavoprotein subunit beta/FixA family protein [Candidatus Bathyarchaeota archaeon]MDW8049187.1 electron transfer flavoprotein subunit beta/FixA family protein [Nitrososphaerota archaeon]